MKYEIRRKKIYKKRTQLYHSWHWVMCHLSSQPCNQQTICSIFIKTEGPSPEQERILYYYYLHIILYYIYYIILFTDNPSSAILSALPFMDWYKERTDRHQPEWMRWAVTSYLHFIQGEKSYFRETFANSKF